LILLGNRTRLLHARFCTLDFCAQNRVELLKRKSNFSIKRSKLSNFSLNILNFGWLNFSTKIQNGITWQEGRGLLGQVQTLWVIPSSTNSWGLVIPSFLNSWGLVIPSFLNSWSLVIPSFLNSWSLPRGHTVLRGVVASSSYRFGRSCGFQCVPFWEESWLPVRTVLGGVVAARSV